MSGSSDTGAPTKDITKDIACQEMLKMSPTASGFVRRQRALQEVGAKLEKNFNRLGRSVSVLSNKIPWQQRFMIMYRDRLYIYSSETATRAQKVLTISNYCKFDATPELNYKDVPWPFGLKPADVELTKTECFSAVSEEELRKWQDAITPRLGSEVLEQDDETDDSDDYDKPITPPLTAISRADRKLPTPPSDKHRGPGLNRTLPPLPVTKEEFIDEYEDGNYDNPHQDKKPTPKIRAHRTTTSPTELANRKVPPVPTTPGGQETKQLSPESKTPPKIAPKPGPKPDPPIKPKPKVPLTQKDLQPLNEKDDLTYEMSLEAAAMWTKSTDEAQTFMRRSGLPEGLYMIRKSTDGTGYTLIVICQGSPCKFRIEDSKPKLKIGSMTFDSLEALILHFKETNLPNKSTLLTTPHASYSSTSIPSSCDSGL